MGLFSFGFGNKARWYLDTFKTSRIKQTELLSSSAGSSVLTLTDRVRPALFWLYDL